MPGILSYLFDHDLTHKSFQSLVHPLGVLLKKLNTSDLLKTAVCTQFHQVLYSRCSQLTRKCVISSNTQNLVLYSITATTV